MGVVVLAQEDCRLATARSVGVLSFCALPHVCCLLCLQIQVENNVSRRRFTGILPTLRYIWHREGFTGYFKVGEVVGGMGGAAGGMGGVIVVVGGTVAGAVSGADRAGEMVTGGLGM